MTSLRPGRRVRYAAAGAAVAVPFLLGAASAPPGVDDDVRFRFTDPRIVESSGLVLLGDGLAVTTNDSGDDGRVFTVDIATGRTVGVTTWSDRPDDVEALAPAGPGAVWVGDIGDNSRSRGEIEVVKVPVGRGNRDVADDVEAYELTYPDQPADAESLLADPDSGRLFVVTKDAVGGTLYAAPESLDADGENELEPLGDVLGVATDAAFFPAGRHLVVRGYTQAEVYTYPGLTPLGPFALPTQQQGEGIAVAADGRLWLSSEGRRAPVLRVSVPDEVAVQMRGAPSPPSAPTPSAGVRSEPVVEEPGPEDREVWGWLTGGVLFVVAMLVLARSVKP